MVHRRLGLQRHKPDLNFIYKFASKRGGGIARLKFNETVNVILTNFLMLLKAWCDKEWIRYPCFILWKLIKVEVEDYKSDMPHFLMDGQ